MGRLGSLLLVVATVATGCGRLGFDGNEPSPDAPDVVTARAPTMCELSGWNTVAFPDPDVDLSVVQTPTGVTAAWIPVGGGALYAANIGTDWKLAGDPAGTMIKAGTWGRAAITLFDGTLIAAEAQFDQSDVKIDVVQPDLSGTSEVACPIARVVDVPMLHAGADRVTPLTSEIGMTVLPFDASFSPMASMLTVPSTGSVIGMSATSLNTTAVVAWSTATTCYVQQVMDMATSMGSQSAIPCLSPELASDGTNVVLVYEGPAGIFVSRGDVMEIGPDTATLLAPGGTAPHVVFDGTRFWVSYRDNGGNLAIGYLASDGSFLATSIGTTATHDAFRLMLVNGAPWLFSAGAGGLGASRYCIPAA